jgi:hypothetical protein
MYIAWDIETCPQPIEHFTPAQLARYEKELTRRREIEPELTETEASVKVRALNPFLGWICCISVVRVDCIGSGHHWGTPKSYVTHKASEEELILSALWNDLSLFARKPLWITFNGKRFDVPFLRIRTLAHNLRVDRLDLMSTHLYQEHPHFDLARLFPYLSLEDTCELLGVASPKTNLDGSRVHEAIQRGDIDAVAAYCEADVLATMKCFLKAKHALA